MRRAAENFGLRWIGRLGGRDAAEWVNDRLLTERRIVVWGYGDAVAIDPDDRHDHA